MDMAVAGAVHIIARRHVECRALASGEFRGIFSYLSQRCSINSTVRWHRLLIYNSDESHYSREENEMGLASGICCL